MKTLFLSAILFFTTALMLAQSTSNLVVFSEDGYKFFIILNGIRQNEVAQTNVKVMGLNQPYYSALIIFEDKKYPSIEKKFLSVTDVNDKSPLEVTYKIKKNSKGQNVLRYFSGVPMTQAAPNNPKVQVIQYNTTPMPETSTTVMTQQVTTTTNHGNNTNVSGGTNGTNANNTNNTNISVGTTGMGINMNVNVNDQSYNQTTSTTTITSFNSTTSNNTNQQQNNNNCNGNYAMSASNFSAAKNTISKQSFDETKLSTAKQIISSNCLLAAQIKELMLLFSFEETRLTLAKDAYVHCVDKNNYFLLNDAFTFSSSVEELNNSIK